jgi:methane/ammonia monooxygenase subunit C
MEELFIAPLHWGFVMLAWCFMATLGLVGQTLPRVLELVKLAGSPSPVR